MFIKVKEVETRKKETNYSLMILFYLQHKHKFCFILKFPMAFLKNPVI